MALVAYHDTHDAVAVRASLPPQSTGMGYAPRRHSRTETGLS